MAHSNMKVTGLLFIMSLLVIKSNPLGDSSLPLFDYCVFCSQKSVWHILGTQYIFVE